jgi:hypothetical protein
MVLASRQATSRLKLFTRDGLRRLTISALTLSVLNT